MERKTRKTEGEEQVKSCHRFLARSITQMDNQRSVTLNKLLTTSLTERGGNVKLEESCQRFCVRLITQMDNLCSLALKNRLCSILGRVKRPRQSERDEDRDASSRDREGE